MHTCLDWSSSEHWSPKQRACVHCGAPTNVRDGGGRPAHKCCAERVADQILRARARSRLKAVA